MNRIQRFFSNRMVWNLLVYFFSLAGIILVLYSTVWGAALSDDSYHYISSARNFLAGRGFDLTPHFAPALPLLLSAIGLFKIDPLTAIRWVNALLFGANIILTAHLARSLTNSSAFSLLAALLAAIFSTLIVVHSWAMSEALYITFNLSGFLIFAMMHKKVGRGIPLFTGLFFGLAATTRYIGISLLVAGGIFWLTEAGKSSRQRLRNTFWFSLSGLTPILLWMIRNQILIGRPTSRAYAWHPVSEGLLIKALNTMFLWLAPGRFVHGKEVIWLGGTALLLVAWLGVVMHYEHLSFRSLAQFFYQSRPVFLIFLSLMAYWVILIVSRSFLDSAIPMDERLLSPVLVMGSILLVWLFAKSWTHNKWLERGVILAVSLVLIITNLTRSIQTVQSYHQDGRGFASARDHISETYAYLRKHPSIPVYSNAFATIYFWTGRVTNSIPPPDKIQAMKEDMRQTGAYLVVFYSIPVELYGTTEKELTEGLVEQIQLSEATIYRFP